MQQVYNSSTGDTADLVATTKSSAAVHIHTVYNMDGMFDMPQGLWRELEIFQFLGEKV